MVIYGTDRYDALQTVSAGDTIFAFAGNDMLSGSHPGATLVGGAGNDRYRLYEPDAVIVEEANGGIDTVWAWDSMVLPDNVENLDFRRTNEWHSLEGNALGNVIFSGNGRQALAGYGGDDTLTGGGGVDAFHVHPGDGDDVVTDFNPGEDRLIRWSPERTTFAEVMAAARETGEGVVLDFGASQSVSLRGIALSDLAPRDIVLATPGPSLPEGARLVFADEFDSLDSLYDGTWSTQPLNGHPVFSSLSRGAREHTYIDRVEVVTAEGDTEIVTPFSVEDGILSITARRTPEVLADVIPEEWISGSLETYGTFAQTYGYYEIGARLPQGKGIWPAFWLTAEDYTWPPEIDLLDIMGDETKMLRPTVHSSLWGDKVTAADQWLVPDMSQDFHDYGMLWTESAVTFYFDGIEIFSVDTPPDMHRPMVMQLNLALGGWNGGTDATTPDGAAFEIDYVRAYGLEGGGAGPRSDEIEAFADVENGILNVNAFNQLNLYRDDVRRADAGTRDLALSAGEVATLVGDAGANLLQGNAEATVFNGRGGDDTIRGGAGDDYLIGEAGDDVLEGGAGAESLVGGLGDDTYVIRRGDGAAAPLDELILERPDEGFDTVQFADLTPADINSHVDWARWRISFLGANGTEYLAIRVTPDVGGIEIGSVIERMIFSDGTVWDLGGGLTFRAGDDDDASSGTRFDDTLLGGAGDDTMAGMDGDDLMNGGAGVDDLYGWNGADTLSDSGSEGGDRLWGEAGNDSLTGGRGFDLLHGGEADDLLRASGDGDSLDGGAGDDMLRGGQASDTLIGGEGADNMNGLAGDDLLRGGDGNDQLMGNDGDDRIEGEGGTDTINGGAGNDGIDGGAGRDSLAGGSGADTIDGGAGTDRLRGEAGADLFRFDLTEIESDIIQDFDAGERIEIHGAFEPGQVSVTVGDTQVNLLDLASGESHVIRVAGAQESDIWLLPA